MMRLNMDNRKLLYSGPKLYYPFLVAKSSLILDTIASRLVLAQVCYELELYPRAFSLLLNSKKCKQSVYLSAMSCVTILMDLFDSDKNEKISTSFGFTR
jgi:hypothetical protein